MSVKYFEHNVTHVGYKERASYKAGCWLVVTSPSVADLAELSEQYNVSATQLNHVRDREELPRLEFIDDASYMFMRHAYMTAHGERETAPLLMILKPDVLLVIIPRPLAQELNLPKATKTLRGTTLQIIEHVLDQYGVYLDEITFRIKSLRRSLHSHEISNQDLAYFVTLEEELNDFVSSLEPLNAIMQRLVLAHHFPLTANESERLNDIILKNQQMLNSSSTLLRSIESIRNAHGTIASNNLNRTMKVLTVATVLLALPNVIFGALGMNIPIPAAIRNAWWAFPATILFTISIVAIVFTVARRKKLF